jgi:beta-lactamase regulating signal transducer with metallopeptidase domain
MPIVPLSPISILNVLPQIDKGIENTISERIYIINNGIEDVHNLGDSTQEREQQEYAINNNEILNANSTSSMPVKRKFISINIFSITWLIGLIMIAVTFIIVHCKLLYKLKKCRKLVNKELLGCIDECKNMMGVKKDVKVYVGKSLISPYIIGTFSPNIYFPEALVKINHEHFKHVIIHELAHYKRKDLICNIFSIVAIAIHWFNPFIWKLTNIIKSDTELACDNYVLNKLGEENSIAYGKSILEVTRLFIATENRISLACYFNTHKQLKRRILMINKFKNSSYKITALTIIGSLLIGCFVLTNPTYANIKNENKSKNNYTSDIAKELQVEDRIINKYKIDINKTLTQNGISITLKEALLRNDELLVTYNINNVKNMNDFTLYSTLSIDGKDITYGSSESEDMEDNTIKRFVKYKLSKKHKKGDLNIKLNFIRCNPINFEKTSGEWLFEFKINGDKLANNTKETLINYKYVAEKGAEVNLDKCVDDGLGIKIYYHTKFDANAIVNGSEFYFKCFDDLGDEVEVDSMSVRGNYGIIGLSNDVHINAKKLSLIPLMKRDVKLEDGNAIDKAHKSKQIVGKKITIDL